MAPGKILLFANTTWYLYNFRRSLAERLRSEGWEVVLLSPPDEYGQRLEELGFRWLPFYFSTRSTNPFNEFLVILRLIKLNLREKPDLVHNFTIKCVLYGSLAARFTNKPPVVNGVTGMGHIFTDSGLKARILRPLVRRLYRFIFSTPDTRVIFQNTDDLNYFLKANLLENNNARLIRGSGVNTSLFLPHAVKDVISEKPVTILFASRLLFEKGILELVAAAHLLKKKGLNAVVHIAGEMYPGNPSSLTQNDIDDITKQNVVTFLGHVDDMQQLIADSDIVVLPSYREGTPRILIEAAAMAKPIVATDIPGCAGLVVDGVNGLLVPVRESVALADALTTLIADAALRTRFGRAGREIVLSEFDETIVIRKTCAIYRELTRGRDA